MKKTLLLLALAPLFLTACGGQNEQAAAPAPAPTENAQPAAPAAPAAQTAPAVELDPILANPQVGDLYAAKLTAFSAASFDDDNNKSAGDAFGLMKVVAVEDNKVIVITEDAAWPEPRGAKNELHGDLKTITWDENERIPIKRSDFADLVAKGDLLDFRRMQ